MRKKEITLLVLTGFVIIGVMGLVSAEILISQPSGEYNIGDGFNFTITLSPVIDTSDFFEASLVCGLREAEVYKSPASVSGGEQKTFLIEGKFDSFLVGTLSGICLIKSKYGDEEVRGQTFELTKGVRVTLEIGGFVFDPGEGIPVSGTAYKNTGDELDGFVDISLGGLNTSSSSSRVVDGRFALNFTIPWDAPAGDYNLVTRAYDSDSSGEVMNEGILYEGIKIRQVVSDVGIAVNEQTFVPGSELIYTIMIYDQSGITIDDDLEVMIFTPENEIFFRDLVKSGVANRFETFTNYSSGYWTIDTSSGDVKGERTFYIEEIEKIEFELQNTTLIIRNVGNVRYTSPLRVTIGGVEEIVNVDLAIYEEGRFRLSAPDGEYDIGIGEGEDLENVGTTFLTGNAIGIDAIKGFGFGGITIMIWLIVLIILGIVALLLYRKIRKKPFIGKMPKIVKGFGGGVVKARKAQDVKVAEEGDVGGISGEIDSGKKQESSIVALKIKNMAQVGEKGRIALDGALLKAKQSKAKIYSSEDYRLIIFAPVLTGERDNSLDALKTAQEIKEDLDNYNSEEEKKISFGVGVHVGDLIVERKEGKFKFTSLGNTINGAKSLAGRSGKNVGLTKELHGKVVGKVKSEKQPGENFWRLKGITDRSKYEAFVDKFLEKQI